MNAIRNWYTRNQDAASWFLIGWLCYGGLDSLADAQYVWAAVLWALAYVNYRLIKFRFQ
jgi:hypothetical protein